MRFQDKVAIVTGGNYGIGRGIAHKFGDEGAKIAVVARNQERSDQVVQELNERDILAKSFKTDLSQEGEVINCRNQ